MRFWFRRRPEPVVDWSQHYLLKARTEDLTPFGLARRCEVMRKAGLVND